MTAGGLPVNAPQHVAIDINDDCWRLGLRLQSQADNASWSRARGVEPGLIRPEARVARLWPKPRERL